MNKQLSKRKIFISAIYEDGKKLRFKPHAQTKVPRVLVCKKIHAPVKVNFVC
jgi:hypothetical protein